MVERVTVAVILKPPRQLSWCTRRGWAILERDVDIWIATGNNVAGTP